MHRQPYAELRRGEPVISPGSLNPLVRVAATKQLVHIADMTEEPAYKQREPEAVAFCRIKWRAYHLGSSDAQRKRFGWRHFRFPPGGPAL